MTSHRCEGRLVSGASPLPGCGKAPLPLCPGRGRCGSGDPAPAPQRALLRASLACCGGGGKASPGRPPGRCLALWRGALVLPWLRYPPPRQAVGVRCPCALGACLRAWGPGTLSLTCMPFWGAACRGAGGGPSRGDGVPPVLGASGIRRCSSPGRPSLGADSRDPLPVCPGHGWCWQGGPGIGPTVCTFASWRCTLWGWRDGVPGGAALRRCEGCLRSGARPPPAARTQGGLSGYAAHVL